MRVASMGGAWLGRAAVAMSSETDSPQRAQTTSLTGSHRTSPARLDAEDAARELEVNVARALIDSNLGDLEELAFDVESMSVYAVRADHLATWSTKIRSAIGMIRGAADKTAPTKRARPAFSAAASPHSPPLRAVASKASLESPEHDGIQHPPRRNSHPQPTGVLAPYASGALHMLVDALAHVTASDWVTCFVYSAKTEELVLACSVGKRLDRPGSIKLSATSGIESHVLNTGIAVNVAHAYAEQEFNSAQDTPANARTKSELVFPIMKPGSTTHCFGILQLCNKRGGRECFTEFDETKAAECAQFVACIIAKFPTEITNGSCFDTSLLGSVPPLSKEPSALKGLGLSPEAIESAKTAQGHQLVFRTARAGHVRRGDLMRDAGQVSAIPTITEALNHVAKIHEAWRNAVVLNVELDREIARLQESLTISKKENQRLQSGLNDLKSQMETSTEHGRRRSSVAHAALTADSSS